MIPRQLSIVHIRQKLVNCCVPLQFICFVKTDSHLLLPNIVRFSFPTPVGVRTGQDKSQDALISGFQEMKTCRLFCFLALLLSSILPISKHLPGLLTQASKPNQTKLVFFARGVLLFSRSAGMPAGKCSTSVGPCSFNEGGACVGNDNGCHPGGIQRANETHVV